MRFCKPFSSALFGGTLAALLALTGCGGITTTQQFAVGDPIGGPAPTQNDRSFEFLVTNRRDSENQPESNSPERLIQILAQITNSTNRDFNVRAVRLQPTGDPPRPLYDSVRNTFVALGNPENPLDPNILWSYVPFENTDNGPNVQLNRSRTPVGLFDPVRLRYTPPPQITADPRRPEVPVDEFGLYIAPDDPRLLEQARVIRIKLNINIFVDPTDLEIPGNTALAPNLYTRQFSAEVPGDGFTQGEKVTWALRRQDGAPVQSGSINEKGFFIAPQQAGLYIVRATSKLQPDKVVDIPVTVRRSGVSVIAQ